MTLVGPGGAGKTRLAIEVARRMLEEFPDGVHAYEASGSPGMAAVAASNIPLAAIPWDATADPDVASAIADCTVCDGDT